MKTISFAVLALLESSKAIKLKYVGRKIKEINNTI